MSLQRAPTSIFTSNDPTTTQLLDKLFQFVHCHVFTYQLGAHNYIRDDRGIFIDPDLAITLWTSAKLLAEGVNITPDIISYCHDQHFPLPSRLLTYNYARGPNPLLGAFNNQREAITAVKECQEEGRKAIQWIVSIAQELMQSGEMQCGELEMRNRHLLEYYKCLTWPGYDEFGNTCREMVPFRPRLLHSPPYSPLHPGLSSSSSSSSTVPPNSPSYSGDLSDFAMPDYMEVEERFSDTDRESSDIEHGGVVRIGKEDSMQVDELLAQLRNIDN